MTFTHRVRGWMPANLYEFPRVEPDELMTQLTHREPVQCHEDNGTWSRVTAPHYPEHEGWVESALLIPEVCSFEEWLKRSTVPETGATALEQALNFRGARYLWGGVTISGIDCSGLIHIAYRRCGRLIPRDSRDQEKVGTPVPFEDLLPGDLITYFPAGKPDSEYPRHIAFWMGEGKILHAIVRGDLIRHVLLEDEPESLFSQRRLAVSFER